MSEDPVSATMALGPLLMAGGSGLLSSLLPAAGAAGAGALGAGALGAGAAGTAASTIPSLASLMGGLTTGSQMLAPFAALAPGAANAMSWSSLGGAAPSLASTLGSSAGSGLLNLGGKILPNVASNLITNAMTPRPMSMAPSFAPPEMQAQWGGRTGVPFANAGQQLTPRTALSLLLQDMQPQQNGGQSYGYGRGY